VRLACLARQRVTLGTLIPCSHSGGGSLVAGSADLVIPQGMGCWSSHNPAGYEAWAELGALPGASPPMREVGRGFATLASGLWGCGAVR
jgi:hypothetical protein